MKSLSINFEKQHIVMTRKFAAAAKDPYTDEYRKLQEVRSAYPYFIVKKHTIRKNPNKECYRGLTYDYMRGYIKSHEAKANVESALAELEDMIYISKCHSNGFRYPTIKKWFLEKYRPVAEFGKEVGELEEGKAIQVQFSDQSNNSVA